MRLAVVGPTHPFKGGVAQHTTLLAGRLAAAGHDVELISWSRQYPARLYPGQLTVDEPEVPPFHPTVRDLAWNRPDSWLRTGRRLRSVDRIILAHVVPVQAVAYRILLAAAGRPTVIICHNVLPHERSRLDRPLVASLLRAADRVVVHSPAEAELAASLVARPVRERQLPTFIPESFGSGRPVDGPHGRILFFGFVRPYKGLDVLVRALAEGPADLRLRIAGEFWGGPAATEDLARQLGVADRVEIRPGYVAADAIPELFADVDALVLPYRSATGSQGVRMGFHFGVPVITTDVGRLAGEVTDGVNGLVVPAGEVAPLAAALRRLATPGVARELRHGVAPTDAAPAWERYLAALLDDPEGDGGA